MKKRTIQIICLLLCALLLCSCAPEETPKYDPGIPDDTLPSDIPANWELYKGDIYDITAAGFELYKLIYPNAYISWSGMGMGRDGFQVDCAGVDKAKFAASGILPDGVNLGKIVTDMMDPRLPHEIPRQPETKVEFDDGVTMRMERAEYPPYADHIQFVIESDSNRAFDCNEHLYKYVDGEWKLCPRSYYARLALGGLYDYKLTAGEPKNVNVTIFANKLGVGLYRLELGSYDIKEGEEYWVEFVVTEDAEPLEPLPVKEKDTNEGYPLNFFWQCKLPENCTALTMTAQIEWPVEASSYLVSPGWSRNEEDMAKELLGEGYTYDAETDTYRLGTKTLSISDTDVLLTDSDPQVQVMELLIPDACELDDDRRGTQHYNYTALNAALRYITGTRAMKNRACEPANGVLNFALKDFLTAKKEELPQGEYDEQYAPLEEVQYLHKQKLGYYSASPVMSDAAESACTSAVGEGFSGPDIFGMAIDGKIVALKVNNMFGSIAANDDSAPVVSPYEAAAAVLPALRKIKQEFSITGARFEYAYYGEDYTTLHPTWVFTVECADGSELYFAVDAHTGELVTEKR